MIETDANSIFMLTITSEFSSKSLPLYGYGLKHTYINLTFSSYMYTCIWVIWDRFLINEKLIFMYNISSSCNLKLTAK